MSQLSERSTLVAGPWSGEFGWELFAWHAYIRSLSAHFDETVIICRETSKDLYTDFANKIIFCNPNTGLADAFFMHGYNPNEDIKRILQNHDIPLRRQTALLVPRRIGWPPLTHYTEKISFGNVTIAPKYVILENKDSTLKYDYVFHARHRQLRSADNWDMTHWRQLREQLGGEIASIGMPEESLCVEGTDDLRGISMKKLFGLLNNAECAFGPSSGPMHLASLCGCPHVVWSKEDNRLRYQENWNPLKTPVLFLSEHKWHPPAEYVYERFKRWQNG